MNEMGSSRVIHRLFVCTSCRLGSEPREPYQERRGARLFHSLIRGYEAWARREGFVIEPTECLSVCPRPCGIALRAPHKHVYVFGDVPVDAADQVIECATAYRRSETGEMPRAARPPALRAGIMARVPPADAD